MVNPINSIHSAVPVVVTDDIEKSILYYTDILGFSADFKHGEPPVYAGVRSGEAEIYFTLDSELTHLYREKQLTDDRRPSTDGRWQMVDGRWPMADESQPLKFGKMSTILKIDTLYHRRFEN